MPAPKARSALTLMAILVAASALNPLAINIFVPALPNMMRGLDTDFASIQLVLSSYLFATAAAQLVLGPLSDRFGRRPVLIGGLAVFVVASLACTLAPSIGVLIGSRVLQGFGGCAGIVLGRAIVRDCYERDQAASMLGYVTMGFAVAPMVGPAIGGILDDLVGWRSIFGLLTGLGVIVFVATILVLPETRRPQVAAVDRPGFETVLTTLVRIPGFWAYALTLAFETAVFFSFLGGTPFVASDMLGMSGTEYGLYFVFVPGGFILGNFVTARFVGRLGIYAMIVTGCAIALVAVVAMGVMFGLGWSHPLALFLPMYCIGFANGLTLANAIAGAVSIRPEFAGTAAGLAGSLQVGAGAVATVIIGALLGAVHSVFALVVCMMAFAVAGLVASVWTRRARTQ